MCTESAELLKYGACGSHKPHTEDIDSTISHSNLNLCMRPTMSVIL